MDEFLTEAVKEISKNRKEIVEKMLRFSLTDMLFFWGQGKELALKQQELWKPILEWVQELLDAKLVTTNGINVPKQDEHSGARMRKFLEELSDRELAAFYIVTINTKSVLVAAALIKKKINVDQAMKAAFLEEDFQIASWGADIDTMAQRELVREHLEAVERFLA